LVEVIIKKMTIQPNILKDKQKYLELKKKL
jgi:hypothetical protein